MAMRRQLLSQRRRAVGLTQESLAELLGVERSTVVRWEAGDTKPLPSIRPDLASALHVSVDKLAELFTPSEDAGPAQDSPADTEVTVPAPLPEVQSQPDRSESEPELVRPPVAETVEALRRALRSGASPADLDAILLGIAQLADIDAARAEVRLGMAVPATVGVGGSDISAPAHVDVPSRPAPSVPGNRATSRRFTRLAAAGVLILAGAAASVPFVSAHRGPIPPTAARATAPTAPEAGAAAPHPGSNAAEVPLGDEPAPAQPAADEPIPPAVATAHTRATSGNRTVRRTTHRAATPPAPPRMPAMPAIPAEAAAWTQMARSQMVGAPMAGHSGSAQPMVSISPGFPMWP